MENTSVKTKAISAIGLLFATMLWGINYIAQSRGSQFVGAFTFNLSRFSLGGLLVFLIILFRNYFKTGKISFWLPGDNKKETIKGGMICGILLLCSLTTQQLGIGLTVVGKAGFLSSLSVIFVPIIGMVLGKKVMLYQWIGIFLAAIGIGLLSLNTIEGINLGDILMLLTSLFIAIHLTVAGYYNKKVDSLQFCVIRFITGSIVCIIIILFFEKVDLNAIKSVLPAMLYSGILASGVAFMLMALSQRHLDNISTSLIMSLESVFAALSGWLILGEILSPRELAGCALLLSVVIGMQLYGELSNKKNKIS